MDNEGFGQPLSGAENAGSGLAAAHGFSSRLSRRGDTVWLALAGELDVFTSRDLRRALRDAEEGTPETFVLDLRGLSFLDSSGLAVILGLHERRREDDLDPPRIMIGGAPQIESLFETIGAAEFLDIADAPARAV